MDKLIEKIRFLFQIYIQIVALVTLGTAIYITIFWGQDCELSANILWEIMGVSALCSICSLFLISQKELPKKVMFLREILHFCMINAIVLFSGFCFEWFYPSDWKMILGMVITIVAVYAGVMTINYYMYQRTADEMNRKLKERQLEEEDDA